MKSSIITMSPTNNQNTKLKSHLFHKILLQWFKEYGRKDLPWQENKTPYRVWISEIMLQQTQVKTVIPYFNRFIEKFPTLASLANAHEDEILHLWSGLGYYSRARNLHAAAKLLKSKFNDEFPNNFSDILNLPGIGESTAAAIMSLAFDKPKAILDGNVKRVLSRIFGIHTAINDVNGIKDLWTLAQTLLPKKFGANYTQAIMDLGATICTPKNPICTHCPFINYCFAYQHGKTDVLPFKLIRKALPIRRTTFLVIKKGQHVLLQKRPSNGIWGSLWCLPELPDYLDCDLGLFCKNQFQLELNSYEDLINFRHTFTHFHLDITSILLLVTKIKRFESHEQLWYNLKKPKSIGLPKPIQTILGKLE